MEKFFKLKEKGTSVKTEILAGLTTFLAMAYILGVNPIILGDAGMDQGSVFMATAISAAFASIVMGLVANYPVALAAGMGGKRFILLYGLFGNGIQLAGCLMCRIRFRCDLCVDFCDRYSSNDHQCHTDPAKACDWFRYRILHCVCRFKKCRYHRIKYFDSGRYR